MDVSAMSHAMIPPNVFEYISIETAEQIVSMDISALCPQRMMAFGPSGFGPGKGYYDISGAAFPMLLDFLTSTGRQFQDQQNAELHRLLAESRRLREEDSPKPKNGMRREIAALREQLKVQAVELNDEGARTKRQTIELADQAARIKLQAIEVTDQAARIKVQATELNDQAPRIKLLTDELERMKDTFARSEQRCLQVERSLRESQSLVAAGQKPMRKLELQRDQANAQVEKVTSQRDDAITEVEKLTSQCDQASTEIGKLKSQLESSKMSMKREQASINQKHNQERSAQIGRHKSERDSLQEQVTSFQKQVTSLQKQLAVSSREGMGVSASSAAWGEKIVDTSVASIEARLSSLEGTLKAAEKESSRFDWTTRAKVVTENKAKEKYDDHYGSELQAARVVIDMLREELIALKTQVQQHSNLEQQVTKLKEAREAVECYKLQNDTLRSELTDLKLETAGLPVSVQWGKVNKDLDTRVAKITEKHAAEMLSLQDRMTRQLTVQHMAARDMEMQAMHYHMEMVTATQSADRLRHLNRQFVTQIAGLNKQLKEMRQQTKVTETSNKGDTNPPVEQRAAKSKTHIPQVVVTEWIWAPDSAGSADGSLVKTKQDILLTP